MNKKTKKQNELKPSQKLESNLENYNKDKEQEKVEKQIKERYQQYLFNYIDKHNKKYIPNYLQNPLDHFHLEGNKVVKNDDRIVINNITLPIILSNQGYIYSADKKDADRFYSALYKVLRYYVKIDNYILNISNYKFNYAASIGDKSLGIFREPEENFIIADTNLCYKNQKGIFCFLPVTSKVAKQIFVANDLPIPSYKSLKSLFLSMKSFLKNEIKEAKYYSNPYYIRYSLDNLNYIIEYSRKKRLYGIREIKSAQCIDMLKIISHSHLVGAFEEGNDVGKPYYPKKFTKLMKILTNYNFSIYEQFARSVASILASRNISNDISVIVCNSEETLKLLSRLLSTVAEDFVLKTSFKLLYDKKKTNKMMIKKFLGTRANISVEGTLPGRLSISDLRKVVESAPITSQDGFIGKLEFINNMHLVYLTKSQKKASSLEENYNTNLINLTKALEIDEELINSIIDDEDEITWIRTSLALYGLKLIVEDSKSMSTIAIPNIIEKFVKECCVLSVSAEVYVDELYSKYVGFYNKNFGGDGIGPIEFGRALKKKCKIVSGRPHHSRTGSNKEAFYGIKIDEDKYNLAMSHADDGDFYQKEEAFISKIVEINIANEFTKNPPEFVDL